MSDMVEQLAKIPHWQKIDGPVVLVVMDGLGIGSGDASDGVAVSYTPVLDGLRCGELSTQLQAHGKAVGLPGDKDMGN